MNAKQIQQLNEVHSAIIGNAQLGQKGIIERLDSVEKYQDKDKKFKWTVAGGLSVGTPFLVGVWQWIVKHF